MTTTGLRVMIVTDQYEPMVGGVPTVTRELARGLAERGHAVAVVAPGLGPARRTASVTGSDTGPVTVIRPGAVRWPWYEGQRLGLLTPRGATRLVASFAPDVVHVHSPLTLAVTVRSASRKRLVPVVYTNHYLPANARPTAARGSVAFDTAFYGYLTGFANRCDRVTAPTATALRLLRDHGLRAPSQVVSNGVDLAVFSPGGDTGAEAGLRRRYRLPVGRPVILAVGRLSPEKRADVLIAAAARLGPDAPDAPDAPDGPLLVLAGTGPDEPRLRALAARLRVAGRVRFLGFVPGDDLPGLYRLADVFAIASPAELQSLATMEAMASGLPVVAAEAGALGELVHAGENGFLVRPGAAGPPTRDTAVAFADCLRLLCGDQRLRASMAKASLRIITTHDRNRVLARWESVYRALAGHGTAEYEKQAAGPDKLKADKG